MKRIIIFLKTHRGKFWMPIIVPVLLITAIVIARAIISPQLTPYLEGPKFRAELDKQTSKGLHFKGQYGSIKRTGFDTAEADEFHAQEGVKAMKNLDASGITAKFNPWGIFLRRWQLDYIRIKKGHVQVQAYEPKPEEKSPKPWYSIFLPDRVYLREVTCENSDVTWQMKDKPGGIFATRLRILPYGRDFEYFAEGGVMRTSGLAPELQVKHIHMVITKKILELYILELFPKSRSQGSIRVMGEMGMRDNKHVDMKLEFNDVPIAPWLPEDLDGEVRGFAAGYVHWKGTDQTIEDSSGNGYVRITDGELKALPLLEFMASATARKSLEAIRLTQCEVTFRWKYPLFEITSLDLLGGEKVALQGSLTVDRGVLTGELDFGLAPTYLDWLPKARDTIFNRESHGLLWTKVRISGTLQKPLNDLTPRLSEALKKDPAAAAGLLLRSAGEWIEHKVKGDGDKEGPRR